MSRIAQVALAVSGASQYSKWLPHDYYAEPFNVSLGVYFGFGLNATLAVQFAIDDLSNAAERQVSLSQTTTTITVKDPGIPGPGMPAGGWGHGLATGDYCNILSGSGGVIGEYPTVTVVDAFTYTVTSSVSRTLAREIGSVITARVQTHPVLTGLTARTNSNYGYPVWGSRLLSTAFTAAGTGFLLMMQGGRSS